ncbi:cdp-diacylglycerol-glycerol-3-phosphate 3, partial [Nannochloropsis oceanica]
PAPLSMSTGLPLVSGFTWEGYDAVVSAGNRSSKHRSSSRLPPSSPLLPLSALTQRVSQQQQQQQQQVEEEEEQQLKLSGAEGVKESGKEGEGGVDKGGDKNMTPPPPFPPTLPLSIFEKALLLSHPPSVGEDTKAEEARLRSKGDIRWRAMVKQLVENSPLLPSCRKALWVETLGRLTQLVVERVDPDVHSGDQMDVGAYIKIKDIPGGTVEDTHYVDGLVFRKNVTHKAMRGRIRRPRILLLSGGIEFQRTESRMASLETLMDQV